MTDCKLALENYTRPVDTLSGVYLQSSRLKAVRTWIDGGAGGTLSAHDHSCMELIDCDLRRSVKDYGENILAVSDSVTRIVSSRLVYESLDMVQEIDEDEAADACILVGGGQGVFEMIDSSVTGAVTGLAVVCSSSIPFKMKGGTLSPGLGVFKGGKAFMDGVVVTSESSQVMVSGVGSEIVIKESDLAGALMVSRGGKCTLSGSKVDRAMVHVKGVVVHNSSTTIGTVSSCSSSSVLKV